MAVGDVNLIAKIAPQNDAFTGMVDAKQVLGGASNRLPAATLPALTGDVTTTEGTVATTIANGAVSLAKMANMATASLLGRNTAGAGAPEVITDIPTAITIGSAYIYRVSGTDVAVADGGTGSSTASGARTNLGLAIGTDVQAYSAKLASLAGLTYASTSFVKMTGANTFALDTNTYSLSAHNHSGTYEPVISAGTTAQYWRGDKSWQTLDTDSVSEATNLYYTDARVKTKVQANEAYTIAGTWTFNNVVSGQNPTANAHLATKYYVDTTVSAIVWKPPVISQSTNDPPPAPADGDRYIVGSSPTGAWASNARDVATWDDGGSTWTFEDPSSG